MSKKGVLVSVFYVRCSQKCAVPADGSGWSATLADYIRNNDQVLVDQAKRLLRTFEEEIQPCESLVELCDVLGLGSSLFALLGSYLCCLCLLFVSSSSQPSSPSEAVKSTRWTWRRRSSTYIENSNPMRNGARVNKRCRKMIKRTHIHAPGYNSEGSEKMMVLLTGHSHTACRHSLKILFSFALQESFLCALSLSLFVNGEVLGC